ncbi:MAG: transposase [bacterium]|nr:transposase [bacterium]
MHKPQFAGDKIYHIYNRGVEKRKIFLNDKDYLRFIHNLFEFNDENPVVNTDYYFDSFVVKQDNSNKKRARKLLVDILAFVLMPNHFHLILRQRKENGIIKFMQKLGTGYTMYFNKKNDRVGGLFQGRFKAVILEKQVHFIHLPYYIHSNPSELIYRGSTSIDAEAKLKFLKNYRWSSFLDYIGIKNFPSVTSRDFLSNFWGGKNNHIKEMLEWLKHKDRRSKIIQTILLD